MFRFPLPDCDMSLIRKTGSTQTIPGIHAMPEMTDPHENSMTRGNGDLTGSGIVYKTGFGTPREQSLQFKTTELLGNLLHDIWSSQEQFDFSIVNRKTGDQRILKGCVIAKDPRQNSIEEGEGSTIITLILRFFNMEDKLSE